MRVTVCELRDDPIEFEYDWNELVVHARSQSSDLVLLPEMPFATWFARQPQFDLSIWEQAVASHEAWLPRLQELAPAAVACTRPVSAGGQLNGFAGMSGYAQSALHMHRYNEGFVWDERHGYQKAHAKYYLPEDECFWEASWYERGDGSFEINEIAGAQAGWMICTELWFMQHAREYGQQGVHILLSPRATELRTVDKWLAGGRASAVIAGAFSLSSNRAPSEDEDPKFGGLGWVIDPDGEVLAITMPETPFVTVEIDIAQAEAAKKTYPRYVEE